MSVAEPSTTHDLPVAAPAGAGDPGVEVASLDIGKLLVSAYRLLAAEPVTYAVAAAVWIAASVLTAGLLMPPLAVGFIRLIDRHRRGDEIEAGQILAGLGAFWSSLGAGLLITAAVAVASAAIVVPGVVLAILWSFSIHFVALQGATSTGAMLASWRLTRRHVGSVLLLWLTVLALNLLGSVVVVGLLVTLPVSLILSVLAFLELEGQRRAEPGS